MSVDYVMQPNLTNVRIVGAGRKMRITLIGPSRPSRRKSEQSHAHAHQNRLHAATATGATAWRNGCRRQWTSERHNHSSGP